MSKTFDFIKDLLVSYMLATNDKLRLESNRRKTAGIVISIPAGSMDTYLLPFKEITTSS